MSLGKIRKSDVCIRDGSLPVLLALANNGYRMTEESRVLLVDHMCMWSVTEQSYPDLPQGSLWARTIAHEFRFVKPRRLIT